GLDNEGHGLGDEDHGLGDESQGLEHEGLGLEEEEVVPEVDEDHVPSTFKVGQSSRSVPEQEGVERISTFRQPNLVTWVDHEDDRVYTDVLAYAPPAAHVQTPPSSKWSLGSLPVSPSSLVVPSPIASSVATPTATISVDKDRFIEDRTYGRAYPADTIPGHVSPHSGGMCFVSSFFRKRYRSSYETPSPSSSLTLLGQKRYKGTSKLILDTDNKGDELGDEDTKKDKEDEGLDANDERESGFR
nr:hypothetical protein [Tanacetum cinerariifolium]